MHAGDILTRRDELKRVDGHRAISPGQTVAENELAAAVRESPVRGVRELASR
jgi:hypothetical protein